MPDPTLSQAFLAPPPSLVPMARAPTPALPGAWPDRSQLSLAPSARSKDGGHPADDELASDSVPSPTEEPSPTDARSSDATMYYDANDTVTDINTEEDARPSNDDFSRWFHGRNEHPLEPNEQTTPSKSAHVQNTAVRCDPEVHHNPQFENVPDVWAAAAKQDSARLPPWLLPEDHNTSPTSVASRPGDRSPRSTTSSDLADVSSTSDSYIESHPSSPITPIDHEMVKGTPSDRLQAMGISASNSVKAPSNGTQDYDPSSLIRFPSRSDGEGPSQPSPSIAYRSPRPLPELPSLTTSLSTATSSSLHSQGPSSHFTTAYLSLPPTTEEGVDENAGQSLESECVLPSSYFDRTPGQVGTSTSPTGSPVIVLDFSEPHSPDSAHFSPPTTELISFASPASSQFQLSLPQSLSDASLPLTVHRSVSHGTLQDSRPQPSAMNAASMLTSPLEACGRPNPDLVGQGRSEPTLHTKRSFLGTVKKMGSRVKHLFKPVGPSTRPRLNSVVSPTTPSHLINVSFAPVQTASPVSRGQSEEHDSLQLPAFTLTDAPTTPPRPSPSEGSPPSRPHPRSRRFSMPLSLLGRTRQPSSSLRPVTPSPTHSMTRLPLHQQSPVSIRTQTESDLAVDRVMQDWAETGRGDNSRAEAEAVVRGLGLDLARQSARRISQRAGGGNL
ncbi:hypothetical protein OF83DRAFT_1170610 [Amylostereum chailletii]|nr:hypothetical protein OF83DRAFT_1170610 [Amylostereum chailletii]